MIFMHNVFAKPHTIGQWLLGSICWLACCVGGWCASDYLLLKGSIHHSNGNDGPVLLVFGCFCLAQWLIWRKVLAAGRPMLDPAQSSVTGFQLAAAYLWWLVIVLLQIISCLLVPIWYVVISTPDDPNWLKL